MYVSLYIYTAFCSFSYIAPTYSEALVILRNIGPNVKDVCFKYKYATGFLRRVEVIADKIQDYRPSLDFFSILIPNSLQPGFVPPRVTASEKLALQHEINDFSRSFNLKAVFLQVEGEDFIHTGAQATNKTVLEDWIRLIEDY